VIGSTTTMVRPAAPVWFGRLPDAAGLIPPLVKRFRQLRDHPQTRATHWFGERFENLYMERDLLPEFSPVADFVLACAAQILDRTELKYGFWFNDMGPGQRTSRHDHLENDELLSAVLYLSAPEDAGELVLHDAPAVIRVTAEAGLLVLFPPEVPHEVSVNRSTENRLSVAFNFGPADAD
jgi:hypothetical protein